MKRNQTPEQVLEAVKLIEKHKELVEQLASRSYSGKIDRGIRIDLEAAGALADPSRTFCFSCSGSMRSLGVSLLNYYKANEPIKPKRKRKRKTS